MNLSQKNDFPNKKIEFSLENIKRVVVSDLTRIENLEDLVILAKLLWCKRYSRPLKDPLLKEYNIYELLYEMCSWEYLDDPKLVDAFIQKDNGVIDAIMEDDEKWFKETMAEGYSAEEAYSDELLKQAEAAKARVAKKDSVEDLPDGTYEFGRV